jgi:hypothetical protein
MTLPDDSKIVITVLEQTGGGYRVRAMYSTGTDPFLIPCSGNVDVKSEGILSRLFGIGHYSLEESLKVAAREATSKLKEEFTEREKRNTVSVELTDYIKKFVKTEEKKDA